MKPPTEDKVVVVGKKKCLPGRLFRGLKARADIAHAIIVPVDPMMEINGRLTLGVEAAPVRASRPEIY